MYLLFLVSRFFAVNPAMPPVVQVPCLAYEAAFSYASDRASRDLTQRLREFNASRR